jgi:DNA-binding response OmpR family regulator
MIILVAEDETDIRNLLKLSLEQEGYQVLAVADGLAALALFREQPVDLAVLDIMMPRLDGLNLLRKIRETSTMPIIMLTARGEDMDKILGLGLGADDYLAKPFNMAELTARIAALLRRSHQYGKPNEPEMTRTPIISGDLVFDPDCATVTIKGETLNLNAKEYKLLAFFMANPGRVFTRQQLYQSVWEEEPFSEDNTVMVHISNLRSKIETDPKNPTRIVTIRGIGYKFMLDQAGSGQTGPTR